MPYSDENLMPLTLLGLTAVFLLVAGLGMHYGTAPITEYTVSVSGEPVQNTENLTILNSSEQSASQQVILTESFGTEKKFTPNNYTNATLSSLTEYEYAEVNGNVYSLSVMTKKIRGYNPAVLGLIASSLVLGAICSVFLVINHKQSS